MTVVVAIKVGDGIVMGADSASTITANGQYISSYFNAEKLFNLIKGVPIGMLTWGLGALDGRSISSLAKDLRAKLSDSSDSDWFVNPNAYSIEEVAIKVRRFFYDELYQSEYPADGPSPYPELGFYVGGYSSSQKWAEVWSVEIQTDRSCNAPIKKIDCDQGWGAVWQGSGAEAMQRIVLGHSAEIVQRLIDAGMPVQDAHQLAQIPTPLIHPTMPIQDAIDLVKFLMDTACGYARFELSAATVAHPLDIAAITPHEKFKWVQRKHYFVNGLNPC